MNIKGYKDFKGLKITIEDIVSKIDSNKRRIKISKGYTIYDNSLQTAISNSEITSFYTNYQRKINKKYIKSIPFPFEKMGDNLNRFNKLNKICQIYENFSDNRFNLLKNLALHLMDIILFDMYFDIKSFKYDVYEIVDNLEIPDETNELECKKYGLWFQDKENPINYILFYSNTDNIINTIRYYGNI
jgi:hypothetical protein